MTYQIDQSGKIEYTSHDTVVAISNEKTYAVKITAKTKRQLQEVFRRQGKPHLFVYRTFAALIFLILKAKSVPVVIIDLEYKGKEPLIKDVILELFTKAKIEPPGISFNRIGNHPNVHYAAYDVFSGEKKADKCISFEEIAKLAIKKRPRSKGLKNA